MRLLAVDVGTERVGIALSDPTGTIAQGLTVVPRRSWPQVIAAVAGLVAAHGAERVVVGLPRRLDGSEGAAARAARAFAARLQGAVGIPVVFQDERLSTAEAERAMIAADVRRKTRRARRDAVAAALILQTYLDRAREERPGEERSGGGAP